MIRRWLTLNYNEYVVGKLHCIFKVKPEFFDHRIREHFADNPFHFSVRRGSIERIGQPDYKIFSLPHVLNALILHLFKGAVNGLTLRIENRLFQRDIDMSLHFA
jgi:hypothetical protein